MVIKSTTRMNEPTWEIAHLFPAQGQWSEEEYLSLDTNRLVEYSDGILEVLDMPTLSHQRIVAFLYKMLLAFVMKKELGEVLFAPLRVQLWPGKYREPDLILMLKEHEERLTNRFLIGADLVVEVVSPDDRRRDFVTKRHEYAQAGIPEYWLVDPQAKQIIILALENEHYNEYGLFNLGEQAISRLLEGFMIDVTAVFNAATK